MTSSIPRQTWDETWLSVAQVIARRSLCVRDQVGAVIVSQSNRIIATGYNGPPATFGANGPCTNWCTRSTIQEKIVGWKATRAFPPGSEITKDTDGLTWLVSGFHKREFTDDLKIAMGMEPIYEELAVDYSDCPSLHAEANALSVCERIVREGGTIYVTSAICFGCAKLIANSGLWRVVVADGTGPVELTKMHRNAEQSYAFLRNCEIKVDFK